MKKLIKLAALTVLAAGLSACQTTAPSQQPAPVDPPPPAVMGGRSAAPAPAASTQQQSNVVITLHLAQERQEPSLIPVDVGEATPLYALPQPVLTQTDMARISPLNTQDQGSFLLLQMNQNGIPKLQNVTAQAQGHFLLLSVQGQLVSVARIGETIADGRLVVRTQGPQHTQAIIQLMQGR